MNTAKKLSDQNSELNAADKPENVEPPKQGSGMLDVVVCEQQPNGRIRWNKVGIAIPRRGGSYSLKLFMLPGWFVMKPRDLLPHLDPAREKLNSVPF